MPRRHRHPRPRNARGGRAEVDPAHHRGRRGREGHDRLVAGRRRRRADRRRAGARRRRHHAQARHRPLQRQILRNPAGQAQGARLCDARTAPGADRTEERGPQALLRAMPADPIDVLAIGASTGGIHALGGLFHALPKRIGVPILVTQHLPIAVHDACSRASSARSPDARRSLPRTAWRSCPTASSSRRAMRI